MTTSKPPFNEVKTSKPPAVDPQSQPSAQSADLKLDSATLLEYVQTTYLNADEWKGPLTLQQYLDRETILQETDLTKDGGITGWILTSDTLPRNPDGSRPILASCESIHIRAYIARGGEVQKVQAHGIASVFTRPEYRGRGYAGRMMAELGKKLENWKQPEHLTSPFSVLFSDIGPKFYARHGWNVFPSTHIHMPPLDRKTYDALKATLPAVEDLALADLQHITTTHYVEKRLQEQSEAHPGTTYVSIPPDMEHFTWHFARDEFQSKLLGKGDPKVKGAIHRGTGLGLIWCRVYAANEKDFQLHILHSIIPPAIENSPGTQAAMAALLLRAQLEAQEWGMAAGVEVWDPIELSVASAQILRTEEQGQVEVITRDKESLCSLRWNAQLENKDQDMIWLANEKYGWC
jgi:GNAT superfamily N-acetyltransferase